MKKIALFILLSAGIMTATAQQRLASFPHPASQLQKELAAKHITGPTRDWRVPTPVIQEEIVPQQEAPVRKAIAAKAGYSMPYGTFFLGIDEAGRGTWLSSNGVIGAWSDSIKAWVWPITATGAYTKVKYDTPVGTRWPSEVENALYGMTDNYSFTDSITPAGGWDEAYAMGANGDDGQVWQMTIPLQTVTFADGTTDKYQMLAKRSDFSAEKSGLCAGGLPSGSSSDGLWPLTLAEPIQEGGLSMVLYDEDGKFLYGTDTTLIDHIETYYDALQAPLYVKSVSVALSINQSNYTANNALNVTDLHMEIQDEDGNVLASSTANNSNLSTLSNAAFKRYGKLLTFPIKTTSAYGEVMSEGLLLDKPFKVVISNFNEADTFGIYAAECNNRIGATETYYTDNTISANGYEPYIMLNGIMPTWENYQDIDAIAELGYETGVHGDTIDINFEHATSPYYRYQARYAGDISYRYFAFYSTFVPYDSVTLMWNLEIECPEYVTMGADYTYNVTGDDDNYVSLWDYKRMFEMWVYATDEPTIGDIIKFGKAGRYTYLRVTKIDGSTDIEDVHNGKPSSGARKIIENGQIFILKDGKKYNLLGF